MFGNALENLLAAREQAQTLREPIFYGGESAFRLLACHVRQNLWVEDTFDRMMLDDSITGSIEIAMLARRRGIAGERTPRGLLTAFAGTAFDGLLRRIEDRPC